MATNGSSEQSAPALRGKAYPITDHTFDVVVVGAGGAGDEQRGQAREKI